MRGERNKLNANLNTSVGYLGSDLARCFGFESIISVDYAPLKETLSLYLLPLSHSITQHSLLIVVLIEPNNS